MRIAKPNILFLNQFLKILVRARKAQDSIIKYPNRSHIVSLVQILAEHNFILSYGVDPKWITVLLHRKTVGASIQLPFSCIELLSTPSRYCPINWKKLVMLRQKDPFSLHILYTPYGLLSGPEAIRRKTGGLLVARAGF